MSTRILAAAVLLLLSTVVSGQAPRIAWQPDYDLALKQAKAEKKPIFILFLMDDEPANDEVASNHLHDEEIVKLSRNFICLIGCTGVHESTQTASGAGKPVLICSKFGAVTCEQHRKCCSSAQGDFTDSPRVAAPQFLFVGPDGEQMLLRHVYTLGPSELARKMRIALGLHDPTKATDELASLRSATDGLLAQANDNNAAKRKEAIAALATSDNPRVLEFLIDQTAESVDEMKRLEAIEAMGSSGNANTLPVLQRLLGAKSNQIRIAVAKALGALQMPDCAGALLAATRKETKNLVRGHLVRALVACDPVTPEHRKFILGMIKSESQADKMNALQASAKLKLDADLQKALVSAIKDSNTPVRGVAYWVLASHGVKDAGEAIQKAVEDEKTADVRNLGLHALATFGLSSYDGPDADTCLSNVFMTAGLTY